MEIKKPLPYQKLKIKLPQHKNERQIYYVHPQKVQNHTHKLKFFLYLVFVLQ